MLLNEDRLFSAVKSILLEDIGESRIKDLEDELEEIKEKLKDFDKLDFDVRGKVDYASGLAANILDYLVTLDEELYDENNVNVPEAHEQMRILLSRKGRKKYYLSRFRL
mgnify:CR=1 FL=1|tara:strand:+ start:2761 stop:3087 length:327 start_codon:yes stop_codon:yes gene_type:complete